MSKIGILYICTGKYDIFWDGFYKSVNNFFLNDMEKHLFVWTDVNRILELGKDNSRIHCYYQQAEKWPFPTLKRFEYFLRAKEELAKMDYILFMNGNLRVNQNISAKEILPRCNENLFVTIHPGFYMKSPKDFTYDRNPQSLAYIKEGEGKYYFAGGFNGGKAEKYLEMVECLCDRINQDLKNNVIAAWHDESHLNCYMKDLNEDNYRILSPAYLNPEGWDIPFEDRITVLDKVIKRGGLAHFRNG